MTDTKQTSSTRTNRRTDTSETSQREADNFRQKMKEMDHTPPVEGPNRTFERGSETDEAKTDGGHHPAENTDEEEDADDDGRFRQKMKDIDHTPPVEGPNRTFERGSESDKDVTEPGEDVAK